MKWAPLVVGISLEVPSKVRLPQHSHASDLRLVLKDGRTTCRRECNLDAVWPKIEEIDIELDAVPVTISDFLSL